MSSRLVVIGGDAAGMSAATNARRGQPDLEIVVLERTDWVSYSACGIPYLAGGDVAELDDLVVRTPNEFRANHRIDVRLGHEVTEIDLDARGGHVRVVAKERSFQLGFDQLVIATGAAPFRPDVPGIHAPWVVGVQTLGDAARLLEAGERGRCRDVVVVGGGYIGLEMAAAFVQGDAKVTLVEGSDHLMGTLDPDLAGSVRKALEGKGVRVQTGVRAIGFEPAAGAGELGGTVQTDAGSLRADLVVLGLGMRPNSALAEQAGLALGPKRAVAVDRRQQTSAEGVWSAGDCASVFHRVSEQPTYVALGTVANKTGRVAGINIGGGYAAFAGVVGTAITKVCEVGIGRTGLTEREAAAAGFATIAVTHSGTVTAGYMPNAGWADVKLVAERGSGRVLGGQIVGTEGVAKRIDTVATALWSQLTVDDLVDLDLSYAPPFSSVWDPIQQTARQVQRLLV